MRLDTMIRPEILGIKPYIPGKPLEETQRETGITDLIKMASNENPLGTAASVKAAMREAADQVWLYPDSHCFALKQKLAAKHGLPPECFFIGNGSDEVIKLFAETFLRPEDEVIIPSPSFSVYESSARLIGASVVPVRADNGFRNDLSKMAKTVTEKTKAVYICNPNNPTGTIVSRSELDRFMNDLPKEVFVVIDEAYWDYVDDSSDYGQGMDYLKSGRVMVLRTFSKIYGLAGLRIGYGIASPDMIGWIERIKEPFSVNLLAQAAAIAALEDTDHVKKSRQINHEGKNQIYAGLQAMGLPYIDTQANFILIQVPKDGKEVFDGLLRQGVIVRAADSFGLLRHIRVTVGTREQNQRFLEALAKVLAVS